MYKIGNIVDIITLTENEFVKTSYTVIDFTKDGYAVCENKDRPEVVFVRFSKGA